MELLSALRTGLRGLARRPGYTLLVTATLALGVGGATAIFSLVHGVLLRPLPFADAGGLVALDVRSSTTGYSISLSIPNYEDWRERNRAFATLGASAGWGFVRETPEGAERVDARAVLGDFFETLGMPLALGRAIPADETGPGAPATVVLGHAFWQRAYGGNPDVLGSALVLDGRPHTVVGVLAEGAGYPRPTVEAYTPMGVMAGELPWHDRGSSFGTVALGRLAPGVTVGAAQQDMNRVTAEVDALEGKPIVTAEVRTLADLLVGDVRRGLWLLLAGAGLVLLIAGANVANLALARGEGRGTEMAVRRALGARGGDLARLLLAESFWLVLLGGGGGVVLAVGLVDVLPRILPLRIPALVAGRIGMSGPVLGFALLLTTASVALFALAPALRAARGAGALAAGARTTGGRDGRALRDGLVVAQVALSLMLLVGSGLLLRSLQRLSRVDKGFDDTGVFWARLGPPRGAFASTEAWLAFHDELTGRLAASPDVAAAAATLLVPLADRSWERRVIPDNVPYDPDVAPSVLYNIVSEDYFGVLGVPLVRGRAFRHSDAGGSPLVVVVDETMAERFWPGEDPIGKRLTLMEQPATGDATEVVWRTVVGVVPNVRHYELTSPSRVQAYVPMRQPMGAVRVGLGVIVRAREDVTPLPGLVRRTLADLRPDIPISEQRLLSEYVADRMGQSRALGGTTTLFGVVAVLLAALGVFGVLSLVVARRAREIGVRLAVGATPRDVVAMVVGQGLALAGVGTLVGLAGSALAGKALGAFLFEVRPWDAGVYAAVVTLLVTVAAAAALHPALRAAGTPPVRALREE